MSGYFQAKNEPLCEKEYVCYQMKYSIPHGTFNAFYQHIKTYYFIKFTKQSFSKKFVNRPNKKSYLKKSKYAHWFIFIMLYLKDGLNHFDYKVKPV